MSPHDHIFTHHEQLLGQISGKLDTLAQHQATMAQRVEGLQREMTIGFKGIHKRQDSTDARIEKAETAVGRLEEKAAAQDFFTVASTKDRGDLWDAMQVEADARQQLASRINHAEGYVGGAAKFSAVIWILLGGVIAAAGWLLGTYLQIARGPIPPGVILPKWVHAAYLFIVGG
jgi:hypothetical protein